MQANNIHGWISIDKAPFFTSNQILSILKKRYGFTKVGHLGTLDPIATGVLPIAIGEATKTIEYIQDNIKEYLFAIQWGESRDTLDITGIIDAMPPDSVFIPSQLELEKQISLLPGDIDQIPPKFSAIHINGRRAYSLARQGIEFTTKARRVTLYKLLLVEHDQQSGKSVFLASCSSGFYVRSLARDIASIFNNYCFVTAIRRLGSGPFSISQSNELPYLEDNKNKKYKIVNLKKWDYLSSINKEVAYYNKVIYDARLTGLNNCVNLNFFQISSLLDFIPLIMLDDVSMTKIKHGQMVAYDFHNFEIENGSIIRILSTSHPNLCSFARRFHSSIKPVKLLQFI